MVYNFLIIKIILLYMYLRKESIYIFIDIRNNVPRGTLSICLLKKNVFYIDLCINLIIVFNW